MLVTTETYAPVILRSRAKTLSRTTGKVYVSRLDAGQPPKTISEELLVSFTRPWVLLLEPIVSLTALYISIIYATLYMFFAAIPIVFEGTRGWSQGIAGLPFVGVTIGILLAVMACGVDNKSYVRMSVAAAAAGRPVEAEARLRNAMIGSIILPIGLFLFAWTTYPSVLWIAPVLGATIFSCGLVMVFISLISYLVDSCRFASRLYGYLGIYRVSGRVLTYVQIPSMLLLRWQQIRCYGPFSPPRFHYSRTKCTLGSEINGRAPFLLSWLLDAYLSRFCSTNTACRYGPSASMRPKQRTRLRVCNIIMQPGTAVTRFRRTEIVQVVY